MRKISKLATGFIAVSTILNLYNLDTNGSFVKKENVVKAESEISGRDVSSSVKSINGNLTFKNETWINQQKIDITIESPETIKNGDYIMFDVQNFLFMNEDVYNNRGQKIGKIEIQSGGDFDEILANYNKTKDRTQLENLKPGFFWGKAKLTFTNVENFSVGQISLTKENMYINRTRTNIAGLADQFIKTDGGAKLEKKLFLKSLELMDEHKQFYPHGSAYVWTGVDGQPNKIIPETWNILQWHIPSIKKGTRINVKLSPNEVARLKKINFSDDNNLMTLKNGQFAGRSTFELNKYGAYIPKSPIKDSFPAKITKSTEQEIEIEYAGEDLTSYTAFNANVISILKDIAIPQIKNKTLQTINTHIKVYNNDGIISESDYQLPVYLQNIETNSNLEIEDETWNINVKYVDSDTNKEILARETLRQKVNSTYNVNVPQISNYIYERSSETLTGTMPNENKTITLFYKQAKAKHNLTVKHVDIDTGEEIADKVSESKDAGYKYTINPLQHEKYDYVEASEALSGTLAADKEITLKYRKKSKTITVNYVDEKGNKIKDPSTLTKKIDEEYTIDKPNIEHYKFKSSDKPLTGRITDNNSITLTYSKEEKTLTVKYIHRSDNGEIEIKESDIKKLEFDKDYSVDKPEIKGYKFKEADSDLTGKLTEDKVINLYYSKYIPGPEGDKGEPGDKGQPGDKGDKGEPGNGNGGAPGRDGETPDVRIDPKTGNWIVNGKDTGVSVFVKNGKDGKDGKDGNTDYNKVYIHYVDYNGNKTKDSETVDKNKLQDKLKDENPQIAKEKDNNIIVVDKDKDNKDNKVDNIIKYNIVSDKGEELLPSVYLSSKAEKPKPEIKGYKYLKTEKVSDTEERVIYTKDVGEKSKDQFTGDITYRLVDQDNKPITTVYYQDDKFQPELDGYKFKEKKKVSDKEYILVYEKINQSKDKNQLDKNKDTQSKDKETSTKLKSIIKDEDGNILDTQYLEKDVHPTIDGYKYKETKEIDKETQELIYTKDKVELKKADVKTGIENISGSMIALFGTLITGGLALMFKRRQNK